MPFWIHPAWADIFLRVREEMGDEIIYYYFNNNKNPKLGLPPFVKQPPISFTEIEHLVFKHPFIRFLPNPSTIFQGVGTNLWLRLRYPLEINEEVIKEYLYNINWDGKDKSSDYSKPLKEIYFYDVIFLRAFNSMLYDAVEYFEGDDEDISQIAELKIKINNICVQVWEEKYGRKWDGITPHVNVSMQDTLLLGYLGYPVPFNDYDEWSWVNLQFVRYKTWMEEIYRNYIMNTAGIVSLSKKIPSNLIPYLWFSTIWEPKIINKPFMNWDKSPFNKT